MNVRDHGLQRERTTLSWRRTALAAALVSVLMIRGGMMHRAPMEIIAAVWLMLPVAAVRVRSSGAGRRTVLGTAAVGVAGAGLLTIAQILYR
ncbi:MAG: hypothetical protein ABS81_05420 [Pseudonocardia sp. SCN 72-86]|nr:MAG: hypothetical protein ABS81_05420 [Pseudonocardia sp. SCN 72-86]